MSTLRILIVEDQTLMRHGLKTILDLEPGIEVVGEAINGEKGIQAALSLRPDVILMAGMGGLLMFVYTARRGRHALPVYCE